ncbi:unnamed protein product [Cunninghamella blakesleeana]
MVSSFFFSSPISHMVSVINHEALPIEFVILDCPTESTLPFYLKEFKQRNVSTVIRCCQPTYSSEILEQNDIQLIELPFPDGKVPTNNIIEQWLQLLNIFHQEYQMSGIKPTVCTHCLSGLGRAPVLVAIALIEFGIAPLDAISFIREKRRGAFNNPQILFLDHYKPATAKNHHYLSLINKLSFGRIMKKWANKSLPQHHQQNQYQLVNTMT